MLPHKAMHIEGYSIFLRHQELVTLLLDQDARINNQNQSGHTPLHEAVHKGNPKMAKREANTANATYRAYYNSQTRSRMSEEDRESYQNVYTKSVQRVNKW